MVLGLIALVAGLPVNTPAQDPAPLAHGKVPGELHHHLKIENEYVRAYYVEVPPHQATELHEHDHDYIYISLGPADVVSAVREKPEIRLELKDGETHFTRGGFAHVARNLGDTPFRNVTIALLKPQGEVKNLCAQIALDAARGGCDETRGSVGGGPGFSVEPQMETREASLDLIRVDPQPRGVGVAVPPGTLIVVLKDSEVQIDVKGKPAKTLHGGEMTWIDAGSPGVTSNPSGWVSSYLQLSLKAAARPSARRRRPW